MHHDQWICGINGCGCSFDASPQASEQSHLACCNSAILVCRMTHAFM
jgi:hypothetical protein